MKNQMLAKVIEVTTDIAGKHGSTILTGLAVVGVIATAIFSAMARPKADEAIEEAEAKKADDEMEAAEREGRELKDISQIGKLTFWEKVKASWKCYILTVITGVLTVACIVGGHVISLRKIGDLAATCNVLQMANDRYEKYAKEVKAEVGEEKDAELRKRADEKDLSDKIKKEAFLENAGEVIITGDGDTLIWDPYAAHFIRSSFIALKQAGIKTTQKAMGNGQNPFPIATMEDFYENANIPVNKRPKRADLLTWNCADTAVEVIEGGTDMTAYGEPFVIMEFRVEPDAMGVKGRTNYSYR